VWGLGEEELQAETIQVWGLAEILVLVDPFVAAVGVVRVDMLVRDLVANLVWVAPGIPFQVLKPGASSGPYLDRVETVPFVAERSSLDHWQKSSEGGLPYPARPMGQERTFGAVKTELPAAVKMEGRPYPVADRRVLRWC